MDRGSRAKYEAFAVALVFFGIVLITFVWLRVIPNASGYELFEGGRFFFIFWDSVVF